MVDDWKVGALCSTADPEAWFPEVGCSPREAKRLCMGCDVRERCLQEALDNDERHGVWGAYSERERRRIKRGEVVALPTPAGARTPKRCEWCHVEYIGDRRFCCKKCSSSAARARKAS